MVSALVLTRRRPFLIALLMALWAISGPAKAELRESVNATQAGVMSALSHGSPISSEDWRDQVTRALSRGEREEALARYSLWRASGADMRASDIAAYADLLAEAGLPLEAARLLLAESDAGRFGADPEPLRQAGRYALAAHADRLALEVLQRVAELTDAGEDWIVVGMTAYDASRFVTAEAALERAIARGGLNDLAIAWMLLGHARFEQVENVYREPSSVGAALEAFLRASCFVEMRGDARVWVRSLDAAIDQQSTMRYAPQAIVEECRLTLEAERRIIILTEGLDPEARIAVPDDAFPEHCTAYFNAYGEQVAEPGAAPSEPQPQPQRIEPPDLDSPFCVDVRFGAVAESLAPAAKLC